MKARLGGMVRIIISGGAPLAPHIEEFLKVTMCSPVVQGYGLTETCAASFIAPPDNFAMGGTVGPPMPVTEFCLESVPDMKKDAQGEVPEGELLLRGRSNFSGYLKMEDKTVRPRSLCLLAAPFAASRAFASAAVCFLQLRPCIGGKKVLDVAFCKHTPVSPHRCTDHDNSALAYPSSNTSKNSVNYQQRRPATRRLVQAEVLEADGWFHTGDIAQLQKNGSIKIVDRKKNIFKLSQGEYVAVEKLEGEFKKCTYVNQIWVYGSSPPLLASASCFQAFVVRAHRRGHAWHRSRACASCACIGLLPKATGLSTDVAPNSKAAFVE
jgi:acyl-CoA synthetase (AMP-forming)/AMP-acid ligase II